MYFYRLQLGMSLWGVDYLFDTFRCCTSIYTRTATLRSIRASPVVEILVKCLILRFFESVHSVKSPLHWHIHDRKRSSFGIGNSSGTMVICGREVPHLLLGTDRHIQWMCNFYGYSSAGETCEDHTISFHICTTTFNVERSKVVYTHSCECIPVESTMMLGDRRKCLWCFVALSPAYV